ncbi:MAG: hypothetical protein U5K43_01900 [Halofilum sp. (in: g-proteobacteria)]|nr:hypothetical protein [Halofilum sp. (in: g-proteobacteria)]
MSRTKPGAPKARSGEAEPGRLEGGRRIVRVDRARVDPGEVGRRGRVHRELRVRVHGGADERAIGAQVLEQARVPGAGVAPGRQRGGEPERVHPRHEARAQRLEARAQPRVRDDRERAAEAGDVVGLAGRDQGDRAARDLGAEAGERHVLGARVEDQRVVDLVAADDEVALDAERRQRLELVAGVDPPGRVLRVAQQQQPRAPREPPREPVEVDRAGGVGERHLDALAPRPRGRLAERRVDRRERRDGVAVVTDRGTGEMDPGHEPGQPDQPLRCHVPGVVLAQHGARDLDQLLGRARVAEHAVVHARVQGIEHRRRGAEIHVRDPHRQDIAPGVAVPLLAGRAAAVDRGVELVHGGSRSGAAW